MEYKYKLAVEHGIGRVEELEIVGHQKVLLGHTLHFVSRYILQWMKCAAFGEFVGEVLQ